MFEMSLEILYDKQMTIIKIVLYVHTIIIFCGYTFALRQTNEKTELKPIEMNQKILSEFIGAGLLLAVITGSGIMGDKLSQGNAAVALLGNSIATGCGLYVLITLLGPISGAHFNPAMSIIFWRAGALTMQQLLIYIMAQMAGAVAGVLLTHRLFDLPIMQLSTNPRNGIGILVSELVATLALLGVIWLGVKYVSEKVATLVAMSVTAGYWFTSSTFFANPAVTLARGLTDTFVGIAPTDVPGFIAAELLAAITICLIIKGKTE